VQACIVKIQVPVGDVVGLEVLLFDSKVIRLLIHDPAFPTGTEHFCFYFYSFI
jgi:hypothetical protein